MGLSKLLTSFAIVQSYWKLSFDYKKSGGKKVYFSGDGSMSIKNLPDDSIVRCPLKHLHPFTPCLPVRGLMLEGVFRTLPRQRVCSVSNKNHCFSRLFETVRAMLAASKTTVTRGKRKVVGFEDPEEHGTFQPFGTQCNRARIGCIQNIRALGKNTLWYSDMSSLFSHVEDLAGEFMPTEYNLSIKAARSAIHWQNFQLVNGKATNTWGAFAASINSYLNVHEDLDFGYSAMMCLAKKEVEV